MLVVGNDYRESPLYRAERVDNYLGMPDLPEPSSWTLIRGTPRIWAWNSDMDEC